MKGKNAIAELVNQRIENVYRRKFGTETRHPPPVDLNPTDRCTVLRTVGYTSVFVQVSMVPQDFSFAIIVDMVSGLPLEGRLQAVLGNNECVFELKFENNVIHGTIPARMCQLTAPITSLAMTLVSLEEKEVVPVYLQPTHNGQHSDVLHSVPCHFVNLLGSLGTTMAAEALLGPQTEELKTHLSTNLANATALTPYCTPVEVEALAGWTLLRLLEIGSMDGAGGTAKIDRFYVPDDIKRLYNLQRANRPTEAVNFREFRDTLLHIKRVASGSGGAKTGDGAFLVNNSALASLVDPHRGMVPVALKTALFLGMRSAAERTMIEEYHSAVTVTEMLKSQSVYLFTRFRPSDRRVTIFALCLRHDLQRARFVPSLERFEAEESRLAEPKYWRFLDDVKPQKNHYADTVNAETQNFPLPPAFATPTQTGEPLSVKARLASRACEIAAGVYLYLEDWPDNLRSPSREPAPLRHVTLAVGANLFHSVTGVGLPPLNFLFDQWLKHVPRLKGQTPLYQVANDF